MENLRIDETDEAEANDIFAFIAEDFSTIERVIAYIRQLLHRPDITGVQVSQIGYLLIGLERLPRVTPGVGIDLSLHDNQNEDWSCQSLHLDEETFCLETGETIYDPAIGSDHTSWKTFEVNVAGERYEAMLSLDAWFSGFAMRLENPEMRLEIDNFGDALDLEWEEDGPSRDRWGDLPSEYV